MAEVSASMVNIAPRVPQSRKAISRSKNASQLRFRGEIVVRGEEAHNLAWIAFPGNCVLHW
jgi:hypothetical protein